MVKQLSGEQLDDLQKEAGLRISWSNICKGTALFLICIGFSLLPIGCGKKGPPVAPERVMSTSQVTNNPKPE
ncbi:MAG: hypothetical protein DRH10_00445 [Deltaproteobacteria bacterium]|nr:MAG: hypothetical protein DRH10_00445 [Deltaproteobacteria bacterium]